MSTDKLAATIYGSMPGDYCDVPADHLAKVHLMSAAARVRARFVVIDRDDLPEVVAASGEFGLHKGRLRATVEYGSKGFAEAFIGAPGLGNDDPEWHEAKAKAHLAAAEHLRKFPPVDEKAVAEMGRSLDRAFTETGSFSREVRDAAASALIADGWTKP